MRFVSWDCSISPCYILFSHKNSCRPHHPNYFLLQLPHCIFCFVKTQIVYYHAPLVGLFCFFHITSCCIPIGWLTKVCLPALTMWIVIISFWHYNSSTVHLECPNCLLTSHCITWQHSFWATFRNVRVININPHTRVTSAFSTHRTYLSRKHWCASLTLASFNLLRTTTSSTTY